jgi:hypothetical protein
MLRTAFIAANYIDLVVSGYFLYPENGHIMELPTSENIDEVDIFADLARNK